MIKKKQKVGLKKRFKNSSLKNTFSEIRKKMIATILLLLLIGALNGIPTPGIDSSYITSLLGSNSFSSMFEMFCGGNLGNMSVAWISVTPYITASILFSMAVYFVPALEAAEKEGESGRKVIEKYEYAASVLIAIIMSVLTAMAFGRSGILVHNSVGWIALVSAIWTFSAVLVTGIGIYIDKKLFGQGISLILLCNITQRIPETLSAFFERFIAGQQIGDIVIHLSLFLVCVFSFFGYAVFLLKMEYRVPTQSSVSMNGSLPGHLSYIPFRIYAANVMPLFMTSILFSFPGYLLTLLGKESTFGKFFSCTAWFDKDHPFYTVGAVPYLLCIFLFTFVYSAVNVSPAKIADDLSKSGTTIRGVRQGKPTKEYLNRLCFTIRVIAACGLCIAAIVPVFLSDVTGFSDMAFSGTSVLIITEILMMTRDEFVTTLQGVRCAKRYHL